MSHSLQAVLSVSSLDEPSWLWLNTKGQHVSNGPLMTPLEGESDGDTNAPYWDKHVNRNFTVKLQPSQTTCTGSFHAADSVSVYPLLRPSPACIRDSRWLYNFNSAARSYELPLKGRFSHPAFYYVLFWNHKQLLSHSRGLSTQNFEWMNESVIFAQVW